MFKYLFALTLVTLAQTGQALPLPRAHSVLQLPSSFTENYDFEGIIKLSNCSGSLIRFEESKDDEKAMVMTNGHCNEWGMPAPGTYVFRKANSRRFQLMDANGATVGRLSATMILYGTMTGTDLMIYEIDQSYAQILQRYKVRPLTLSSQRPTAGMKIDIVSGYWHRGYSCEIDGFAYQLKEGAYTWDDSIRYTSPGCEVIGGTSGSPVIEQGTRTVIAINNTGNEHGGRCTDNNPCEVDEAGNITVRHGINYAEQTYWVYSCLNKDYQLDLTVEGCKLYH